MSDVISMEPIKERLRKLADYVPELRSINSDLVNDIGTYLGRGLKDKHTPEGFYSTLVILINNLQENVNKHNIQPSSLLGLHPAVYESLIDLMPQLTESICSGLPKYENFVKKVKESYEEVLKRESEL